MGNAEVAIVVAIFVALFGVCIGLGAFIAKSVINRVSALEGGQTTAHNNAVRLEGRVLRVEGELRVLEGKKK